MSFGDPNNPYGQQQPQGQQGYGAPQGQPGYGYPQQAPQGVPQQGYGYPQQQPGGYPAYPGGAGGAMTMPGLITTSRVLLFIVGGLQILFGIIAAIAVAAAQDVASSAGVGDQTSGLAGLGFGLVFILLAFAACAIVLGVKFGKGGNATRICAIVYSSLFILGSLANFAGGTASSAVGAIVGLAIGGIILAAMVNSQASAWFNRPRY